MPAKHIPNHALGAELAKVFGAYIAQGGFVAERETKRRTPVDTGTLRNSWHTDVVTSGSAVHVEIGSNVEYAVYVEFGTSRMEGRHMLANGIAATARWLAKKGFKVSYDTTGG